MKTVFAVWSYQDLLGLFATRDGAQRWIATNQAEWPATMPFSIAEVPVMD